MMDKTNPDSKMSGVPLLLRSISDRDVVSIKLLIKPVQMLMSQQAANVSFIRQANLVTLKLLRYSSAPEPLLTPGIPRGGQHLCTVPS